MPGPLPNHAARRRNAPTIAGTVLPAEGYDGPTPDHPSSLGGAGLAWWLWAWRTPQAFAWDAGAVSMIGRRAALEDDLAAIGGEDFEDLVEFFGESEPVKILGDLIRRLRALASGKLGIAREMRELDDRLGLTPKGRLALRWSIGDLASPSPVSSITSAKPCRRLEAVDKASESEPRLT